MQIWQDLIKYSLIGAERQTTPLTAEGDLHAYIAQLYPNNTVPTGEMREQALLSAAALVSQYRFAGQQPTTFSGTLPSGDESEPLPVLSPLAVSHLQRLLSDSELKAVLPEWLTLAANSKHRVPFALIPSLLELASQNRSIRPAITALIDKRGVWLAKQHPEWQKFLVQADDEILNCPELWEEGTTAQRTEFLRQTRAKNAEAARELLQTVWKKEPAAARESFLGVFSLNLSDADEDFLNTCFIDRSKSVREVAMILLAKLPNSEFSQRHKQRLNQWIRFEKGGLLKKDKIIVELPEAYDKTWLADGIEEKSKVEYRTGIKSWWLMQALSFVSPAYWSELWQLSPDEIFALLEKHEWKALLHFSWIEALKNSPNSTWSKAFLWHEHIYNPDLWLSLTPLEKEQNMTQFLISTRHVHEWGKILNILSNFQHPWSIEFSTSVIRALINEKVESGYLLPKLANYLAPECADLIADYQKTVSNEYISNAVATLNFRSEMIAALTNPEN